MYAIVTIAGQQFKVEEGQELFVHQLEAAEGDNVSFDQVQRLVARHRLAHPHGHERQRHENVVACVAPAPHLTCLGLKP